MTNAHYCMEYKAYAMHSYNEINHNAYIAYKQFMRECCDSPE